jgi:hypothetical protein
MTPWPQVILIVGIIALLLRGPDLHSVRLGLTARAAKRGRACENRRPAHHMIHHEQ